MTDAISGEHCMISEWILLVVVYAAVAVRIYSRLSRLRERLNLADSLLIISAADALALVICDTLTYQTGALDGYVRSQKLSKILFASNYFYDFGMGFPKASMLTFYWNFFAREDRRAIRNSLSAIGLFVAACYLAILFSNTFYCGKNVSVQWSQADDACSVFYARTPFLLNFALSLTCYLAIYVLPTTLLVQGILETSTAVALTLAMGTLPIVTGIVRFICLKVGTGQENLVYILSMVELTLAIIVASLPGLKAPWLRNTRAIEGDLTATVELREDKKSLVTATAEQV